MKYKVMYLCYLTKRDVQKQLAFISEAEKNARIDSYDKNGASSIDNNIKTYIFEVEFFASEQEAVTDAERYCHVTDIYKLTTVDVIAEDGNPGRKDCWTNYKQA